MPSSPISFVSAPPGASCRNQMWKRWSIWYSTWRSSRASGSSPGSSPSAENHWRESGAKPHPSLITITNVFMNKPLHGLMLGDAPGIGPEICARLLAAGTLNELARVVVIGDARVLELGMRDAGVKLGYRSHATLDDVRWPAEAVPLVDLGNIDPARIKRGEMSAESGRLTGETLKEMIDLALSGKLNGICFAPLNKSALHAGGWKFHDEHQMFAKLTGHSGFFGEMNVIPQFSPFPVTSHLSLREAVNLVTPERVAAAVKLADTTLRAMGHERPRIGVAALNPHG